MSRVLFRRAELLTSALDLGSTSVDLSDYATTGLRIVAVGPSGIGKTNAGLLIAEQLAAQGWMVVCVDPEGEIGALYPDARLATPAALERHLCERTGPPLVVVSARDAGEFLAFGQAVMAVADALRRPIFLMLDEAQLFSTSRRKGRADVEGQASDLVTDLIGRGRKRALDVFLSAQRFAGTLHRSVFANRNLTLVGRQEDPSGWFALAPLFKGSGIGYTETAGLGSGEFFMASRRGLEKVTLPMASALAEVAPKAAVVRQNRPMSFVQWDTALRAIPTPRLRALTQAVVGLLGAVAGLSAQQLATGRRALEDEIAIR